MLQNFIDSGCLPQMYDSMSITRRKLDGVDVEMLCTSTLGNCISRMGLSFFFLFRYFLL